MSGGQLETLTYGLRHLRRAPDLIALRAARSPHELARLALIPAARNLGIAVGFLPADVRAEATAALLACRVLDAYEDLFDRRLAGQAIMTAVDYLNGSSDTAPPPIYRAALRDSEAVDRVLAERIRDIRALLMALPASGRKRVGAMLSDVGAVMAGNLDALMPRAAYSEGVLGRVVLYAITLVAENSRAADDLGELAGCAGIVTQLANDLRDGELALYDAADRDELTQTVLLRVLAPSLGAFALLARIGPRTPSGGARTAMAYMTITTSAFLCAAVGAPGPYPRRFRIGAAALAASSPTRWAAMLHRVQRCVDEAIRQLFDGSPNLFADADLAGGQGSPAGVPALGPLIVDTTFALVHGLPEGALTGELSTHQVRRMMVADHLAFGAVERLQPGDADGIRALATQFQLNALNTTAPGVHR